MAIERMSLAAAVLGAGLWLAGAPSQVRALCPARAFQSLWTFPAHGQRDVPTNAQLWMRARALPRQATLNGERLALELLSRFNVVRASTPELEPATAYRLVLEYEGYARTGDVEPQMFEVVVEFETGDGPALDPPSPPVVRGHELSPGWPEDHACVDLIHAQGCFDSGQDTLVTFDVELDPTVVGWVFGGRDARSLIEGSNAWEHACGKPALYLHGEPSCVDFHAIGPAGQLSRATTYCPQAIVDPEIGPSCYEVIELKSMPFGLGDYVTQCDDGLPMEPPLDAGGPIGEEDAAVDAGMDDAHPAPDPSAGADGGASPAIGPQPGEGIEPEGAAAGEASTGMQDAPEAREEASRSSRTASSCSVSTTAQRTGTGAWLLLMFATLALCVRRR